MHSLLPSEIRESDIQMLETLKACLAAVFASPPEAHCHLVPSTKQIGKLGFDRELFLFLALNLSFPFIAARLVEIMTSLSKLLEIGQSNRPTQNSESLSAS